MTPAEKLLKKAQADFEWAIRCLAESVVPQVVDIPEVVRRIDTALRARLAERKANP